VVVCDPSGVVQPVIHGPDQFLRAVRRVNGLALKVTADGFYCAGDETFWEEIELLATQVRELLDITRTLTGWRIAYPELIVD